MSQSLEVEVIKRFVSKEKQSRYIQFVSSEKARRRFVSDLPHFKAFKWELLEEVHKNEAQEIEKQLKTLNIKAKECYVISENSDIDKKVMPFDKALKEIGSMATILVFEEAKMIYYEGEPPKNRYIGKTH